MAQSRKLPALGKADLTELNMKECSFDKTASALKLLDVEEKEIEANYELKIKTERRVRIKIFDQKGFKAATVNIPFISKVRGTKITNIDAYVYYLDGTGEIITEKLNRKEIFRDEVNDYITSIKFTFPNVKPGCVVEYRYEKIEKNSLHLEPWHFQDFMPTAYSAVKVVLPSYIEYTQRLVGIDSVNTKEAVKQEWGSGQILSKEYALTEIPAFKPEPFMTSVSDNLKRIEFAIQPPGFEMMSILLGHKRWNILAKVLSRSYFFGKQFDKIIPGTEAIIDSVKNIESSEERINYIFEKVKKQIKWNEQQTFYAGNLEEVWKEGTGNSADINVIILNLLKKVNIECSPLLISTRFNGKADPDFFSLSQFNGVNVLILDSTKNFILDGTRKYQSYKTAPDNILNRYAFNADTTVAEWIYISDSRPLLKTIVNVKAILDEEGVIKGETYAVFHDHSRVAQLTGMEKTENQLAEEEKEFLTKDLEELKIDSMSVENEKDNLSPLVQRLFFSYKPSRSDDFLFIYPDFLSRFRKNPFTDSARQFSIDFNGSQYLKTSFSLTIPDSYEIDHLPASMRLRGNDSSIIFERRVAQSGNKIAFSISFEILNPLFEKEDYSGIKDFFDKMYLAVTDQIILKKKK